MLRAARGRNVVALGPTSQRPFAASLRAVASPRLSGLSSPLPLDSFRAACASGLSHTPRSFSALGLTASRPTGHHARGTGPRAPLRR
eukprot:2753260-Lingulodinium_polyedra.AAC.1